jgi:hypothetical protein
MHLGFLVGSELKPIKHASEASLSRFFGAGSAQALVGVQSERAGRNAQQEYH